jgi:hypothetical protein
MLTLCDGIKAYSVLKGFNGRGKAGQPFTALWTVLEAMVMRRTHDDFLVFAKN